MRFSIIWLIALVTVFLAWFWLPLLLVWFILWVIGLFYKPRAKARVAVCIPLVVCIAIACVCCYVWNSVKTPATQFWDWAKVQLEQLNEENFDNDRFSNIANEEFNNAFSGMTEEDFKLLIEDSTWSNMLEKWAYVLFGLLQQGFENSWERYNNELPEVDEEDANDVEEENVENEENTDEENTEEEVTVEENTETFSQSEQNDIEEILDILE